MRLFINGDEHELPEGTTVVALLARLGLKPERVAVERNRLVVKRATWAEATLAEGDAVEILTFVGGG
jgi:thiamine biosynthesis protein ThiS